MNLKNLNTLFLADNFYYVKYYKNLTCNKMSKETLKRLPNVKQIVRSTNPIGISRVY